MLFSDEVFPFRFAFDRDLVVQEVGKSLTKMSSEFRVGAKLSNLVIMGEPAVELEFEQLSRLVGRPLQMLFFHPDVEFRCQFLDGEDRIRVIGTPQFGSLEAFESAGLDISDFAAHDTTVETLLLGQGELNQVEDQAYVRAQVHQVRKEQRRLASVERSLEQALSAAGDILLRLDNDVVVEARSSRDDLMPCVAQDLVGQNVYEAYPQIAGPLREAIEVLNKGEDSVAFTYKVVLDGEPSYLDAQVTRTPSGENLLLARDVTDQRQLKLELQHQATHDPLTDLPNRTLFIHEVERALTLNSMIAVLFLDLDGFKLINDRHGHQLGDQVLVHVAHTLRRCIRPTDVAARFGGDEFAIVLKGVESRQAAEKVAQRLIGELLESTRIGHRTMSTSVSIGIASSYDVKDATTLFQFADIAMYEAKAKDKCCYQSFRPTMYEELVRRDTIQRQLVAAGTQGQFINHYQPILDVLTRRVIGVEALARWQHPIRGLLLPQEFMAIAEESDAIVRIGEQSIENACRDMQQWDRDVAIHFNLATRQLRKTCVTSFLAGCLERYDFSASRLTAEINERTLQEDFELASREIDEICRLGVHIGLDEFGAGNYSLAFLERLPIQYVKLARTLVQGLGNSSQKNQLVESVVHLAHAFGLEVIADGVETPDQLELLTEFGCSVAQGGFFSPPITSDELGAVCSSQTEPAPYDVPQPVETL